MRKYILIYERISKNFQICKAIYQESGFCIRLFNPHFFGQFSIAFDSSQYDQRSGSFKG